MDKKDKDSWLDKILEKKKQISIPWQKIPLMKNAIMKTISAPFQNCAKMYMLPEPGKKDKDSWLDKILEKKKQKKLEEKKLEEKRQIN
mgnify:CR=1 FL=1